MKVLCKKPFSRATRPRSQVFNIIAYYLSIFSTPIVGNVYTVVDIKNIGPKTYYILEGFPDDSAFATENFEIQDIMHDYQIDQRQETKVGELHLN